MAKRDLSRPLGGMVGKAAGALRGRGSAIDAALGDAVGKPGGKAKKIVIKQNARGKRAYK